MAKRIRPAAKIAKIKKVTSKKINLSLTADQKKALTKAKKYGGKQLPKQPKKPAKGKK